jgi:pyrimidine operon attenuation protein/uracil phosphoribosyltransferase
MPNFVLTKEIAYNKMQRMAYEIIENNFEENEIILAGIKENGIIIANIIYDYVKPVFKGKLSVLEITIDKKSPKNIALSEEINFDDKVVIITDDVTNSGRTLLYAVKPFLDFYPKKIQTLVLVERSYQQFPLSPDYVGMSIATALSEKIIVEIEGKEIAGARIEQ